jgi:hypothetical protein
LQEGICFGENGNTLNALLISNKECPISKFRSVQINVLKFILKYLLSNNKTSSNCNEEEEDDFSSSQVPKKDTKTITFKTVPQKFALLLWQ